ncbi:hypothetical protein P3T76_014622 [Phytophthora citrophthora]|uniref:Uncharacterized protein n=1 Tax=Phytophthora citrophthora TaxID=4793 RepID=A0AAD9LBY9_9STRA|nr:hypothetical protein P3T76_014622 [Phytophthora citrophthora]
MTLCNFTERPTPAEVVRPPAAKSSSIPSVPESYHQLVAGKRFTVRDGFHLKSRNAEAQAAIDAHLDTSRVESSAASPEVDNEILDGPTKHEITSALPLTNTNNNLEEFHQSKSADRASGFPDEIKRSTSNAVTALDQLQQPQYDSGRSSTSKRVQDALKAPAEWLIHRHRPSETQRRKQRKAEKLLNEILHEPQKPQKLLNAKQDEVRTPRRPRCQSTLGSTYSQRVAAARPQNHNYHREALQPLTETERGLLRSREDNNKAVDKLLVSLFHSPAIPSTTATPFVPVVKPMTPTSRFSTRRSVIRHETAVALRSRNLVSRMDELRSLPQLLEQMEALQVWKQQQHIAEHGVDIVARNRANPSLQMLQKPSRTPLLPSVTDHKVHQANKRKQELDEAKDENVRRIVIRWQIQREKRAEDARRVHVQSQWLLLVALAESSAKWLTRFHEFRQKRGVLVRVIMANRLQRYWRQHVLVKRNSLRLLPTTPLSSAFYRMPVVIQAVIKLQQSTRDWLERKHNRERKEAVALIVTAWFEFQDVKFRRIILRFRKRVRDFQVMWRAWRSITAARIKLLLLVWAKLERKGKRRHGVTASHPSGTFILPGDPLSRVKDGNDDTGLKASTLLDALQRSTTDKLPEQQQKQLEDMHRHFRNGGTVHMPISVVSPGSARPHTPSNINSPSAPTSPLRKTSSLRLTDNVHVRQDLKLRDNMEEEFQLVMYDVYSTRQSLSPTSSKSPVRIKQSPCKTRPSPRRDTQLQSPALQLPPASSTVPVPPSSKKVPHQVKVAVLRKLLSEKRKLYSDARDRGREAWAADRKQMRSEAFRYDVLDELAAFQQLQAKYATFLLLHSITETEMVRLIHKTQEDVHAAEAAVQTHRKSLGGINVSPRKSSYVG